MGEWIKSIFRAFASIGIIILIISSVVSGIQNYIKIVNKYPECAYARDVVSCAELKKLQEVK